MFRAFTVYNFWDLQWAIKAVMNHHISQFIIERNSIDLLWSVCMCVCVCVLNCLFKLLSIIQCQQVVHWERRCRQELIHIRRFGMLGITLNSNRKKNSFDQWVHIVSGLLHQVSLMRSFSKCERKSIELHYFSKKGSWSKWEIRYFCLP